jgi:hypothetical protein
MGRLMSDEIVCLVAADHPALRNPKAWTLERYLACEHIAPTPLHPGARGVIDELLGRQGLSRQVAVRSAHFGQIPQTVARTMLVLTTGRLFCSRYVDSLPVRILRCPVPFPALNYYQLWHDLTHASAALRWLREQTRGRPARSHRRPGHARRRGWHELVVHQLRSNRDPRRPARLRRRAWPRRSRHAGASLRRRPLAADRGRPHRGPHIPGA